MKKVLFFQDIGVDRSKVNQLLQATGTLTPVWSRADGKEIVAPEEINALVTANIPLSREVIVEFPNVEVISVSFTGYDQVDADYCREKGIAVYNVPAYSTDSVAELAIGLTISLLRDIPTGNNSVRSGGWHRQELYLCHHGY